MDLGELGAQSGGGAQVLQGRLGLPRVAQQVAEIVMREGVVRVDAERLAVARRGARDVAGLAERDAEVAERGRVAGRQRERPPVGGDRLLDAAELDERQAQIVPGERVAGIERERAAQVILGLLVAAEVVEALDVGGIERERPLEGGGGLLQPGLPVPDLAEAEMEGGDLPVLRDGKLREVAREVEPTAVEGDVAGEMKGVGVAGVEEEDEVVERLGLPQPARLLVPDGTGQEGGDEARGERRRGRVVPVLRREALQEGARLGVALGPDEHLREGEPALGPAGIRLDGGREVRDGVVVAALRGRDRAEPVQRLRVAWRRLQRLAVEPLGLVEAALVALDGGPAEQIAGSGMGVAARLGGGHAAGPIDGARSVRVVKGGLNESGGAEAPPPEGDGGARPRRASISAGAEGRSAAPCWRGTGPRSRATAGSTGPASSRLPRSGRRW